MTCDEGNTHFTMEVEYVHDSLIATNTWQSSVIVTNNSVEV